MKIESFYLNDISNYDDIVEYINTTIDTKFYGVGKNSISISRLISFLKKSLKIYINLKYQKNLNIIMTLPSMDEKIIIHDIRNDNKVKIRLSYDKISSILNGEYEDYINYIQEIIDQLETEITSNNKFSFTEYLIVQLEGLSNMALAELRGVYSSDFLKENIIKKESWIKLSQSSNVFKDYYTAYMDNPKNKGLFYTFLKSLVKKI